MNNKSIGTEPVYDARTLGAPRMFILGLQHMFAMFASTSQPRCCSPASARCCSTC